MSSICIEITDANFEAEVAKSPLPIVIDFWAVWCGPCRAVAPHVESLAQEYAGRVRFGKCDVDVNQDTRKAAAAEGSRVEARSGDSRLSDGYGAPGRH